MASAVGFEPLFIAVKNADGTIDYGPFLTEDERRNRLLAYLPELPPLRECLVSRRTKRVVHRWHKDVNLASAMIPATSPVSCCRKEF